MLQIFSDTNVFLNENYFVFKGEDHMDPGPQCIDFAIRLPSDLPGTCDFERDDVKMPFSFS